MRGVLVDAGPLVALLDRGDQDHENVSRAFEEISEPLVSVWPALVEAMYLLSFSWRAQEALWQILESRTLHLAPLGRADFSRIKELMKKYRDLPMDLADAALVRVAERDGIHRVLTTDRRDFAIYRLHDKQAFTILN